MYSLCFPIYSAWTSLFKVYALQLPVNLVLDLLMIPIVLAINRKSIKLRRQIEEESQREALEEEKQELINYRKNAAAPALIEIGDSESDGSHTLDRESLVSSFHNKIDITDTPKSNEDSRRGSQDRKF